MHKLLLADDSVTIQRVIELTFSGEDIQVIAVNDGEQAIARIPVERPDIVLADIGMPKRSGYDVAAFVKGHPEFAHIPVLLLAGAFERVDEARAEQVKCDGVLVKPFEPRHVVSRVRELVEGAKGSAARVAAEIPRAAERLAQASAAAPEAPAEPQVEAPTAATEPPPSSFLDASLDDYFEKLNAAFEDVRTPSSGSGGPDAGGPRRGSDSLDGYFDRLSAAFADLAQPIRESEMPPESFDRLLDEPLPTMSSVTDGDSARQAPQVCAEETASSTVPSDDQDAYASSTSVSSPMSTASSDEQPEASLQRERALPVDETHPVVEEDVERIADVLSALLAEQGDGREPGDLAVSRIASSPESLARDALVEEVTRRVLDRLVPEVTASLRRLVADELERIGMQ